MWLLHPKGRFGTYLDNHTPAVSDKAAILKLSADNKTLIQDPNDDSYTCPGKP